MYNSDYVDNYFDFLSTMMFYNPYPKSGWRALYLTTQLAVSLGDAIWVDV